MGSRGSTIWWTPSLTPLDLQQAQLGLTDPELVYVRLSKLQRMTVRLPPDGSVGTGFEQNLCFKPGHSLRVYSEAARRNGTITDDPRLLDAAQDRR